MRTSTRATAIAVTLGICLTAGACSRSSGGATASGSHKPAASKSAVLIISTLNNPFFVSVKNGAVAEAKQLGIRLDVENANNSSATELNQVTTAVTQKPGALVLDPVDSDSATAMVNMANQAGIPVVGFDREPTGGKLVSFVGYDAIAAGKRAADSLATKLGGKGTIVEIEGTLGTNVAQDRSKGFEQELKKYPGITIVAKQSANFDRGTALNVMTNVLQAHPSITGVYAANDEMAMGVLAALKARGLADKVTLVGNDGILDSLQAIGGGQMYATNAESPYYEGQQVIRLVQDSLAGKSVSSDTTLEGRMVTRQNAGQYCEYLVGLGDSADCPASLR